VDKQLQKGILIMYEIFKKIFLQRLVTFLLKIIAIIFGRWNSMLEISILIILSLCCIIIWTILSFFPSIQWHAIIIFKPYQSIIPIILFLLLIIPSMLLIKLLSDMGLIYFSSIWKKSGFDFDKKLRESEEVWYITTVGRFLLKDASDHQIINQKTRFKCLFLDPWSDYFNERMQKERPEGQKIEEARNEQLKNCKTLISMKKENIQVRWYRCLPIWRMIIFDRRYVSLGWFPDYSEKPKANENKGYSGPLFVFDCHAERGKVILKDINNKKMLFPMSLIANAFIKYFESMWLDAGEDLKFYRETDKITTEKTKTKISELGIENCWASEKESPYTLLSFLAEPKLKAYRYLELSAKSDREDISKYLRMNSNGHAIECFIMFYDPRNPYFIKQIISEKSKVQDAILEQDHLINRMVNAKQTEDIKNLEIRFLNEYPLYRYAILTYEKDEKRLFMGHYAENTKGYEAPLWEMKNSMIADIHRKNYEVLWKKANPFDYEEYMNIRKETNLLNFLNQKCPIQNNN
jgi:hypothetical protein